MAEMKMIRSVQNKYIFWKRNCFAKQAEEVGGK